MNEKGKEIFIRKKLIKSELIFGQIKNFILLGYFDTSVNRIYYSCFYCVQALLAKLDIYPKSHKGVLIQFNLHYVKKGIISKELGLFFQDIFDQRLLSDYDETYEASPKTVKELLANALIFFEQSKVLLQEK